MKILLWLLGLGLLAACSGLKTEASSEIAQPEPAVSTVTPAAAASLASPIENGRTLFRNKGCVSCHVNNRVEGLSGVLGLIGPDLTNYTNDPAFLRRWLANPAEERPGTEMPNLRLSAAEIEDLIAFLNEPR
jgi:cytochrome c2